MIFHQIEVASQCLKELKMLDIVKKKLMNYKEYSRVGEFVEDVHRIFEEYRPPKKVSGSTYSQFIFLPLSHLALISWCLEIWEFPSSYDESVQARAVEVSNFLNSEFKLIMEGNSESEGVPAARTPGPWEFIPLRKSDRCPWEESCPACSKPKKRIASSRHTVLLSLP